jgi:hypothetical protein
VTEKVRIKHRQCMEHVWSGCLSDVPGIPMYFECGTKGGLPRYATLRGTSQLECYHRWLRACISGSRIGAGLFKDLLAHFNYRWNHRCDIRSRGGADYGTYSIWILEQVAERSGRRAAEPILPGLVSTVSRAAVLAKGIDLDAVGFRMPSAQPSALTQPAATCMDDDGAEGPGEDDIDNDGADSYSESDSESGEDAESGESGDGSALRPLDLSALEKSISGDTSQASILSYEPVQTCVEIELIMRLVGEHSSSTKRKASKKPGIALQQSHAL